MFGVTILVIILFLCGLLLLLLGKRSRQQSGLPSGEVIYADTDAWQRVVDPLLSRRFGLVGKPDYLVEVTERRQRLTIPIEVKSRNRPAKPYDSHILQLATYCLLVEDFYKVRPPYGLLRYADATIKIPFTDQLRRAVLTSADALRRARKAKNVSRQHQDQGRCQGCGYRHACGTDALPTRRSPSATRYSSTSSGSKII